MKIKPYIFVFFVCAINVISVVAIEPWKDEIQFGAIKDFKIKVVYDIRKPWTIWNGFRKIKKRSKKVEEGSQGYGGEVGAQSGGEQNESGSDTEK
ncbi:unnamed protein product [Trifolium pratense]|uniref:Uncharacterized protein n=1 Tax=Trifolium pratense TaxID=57577 RepID=A0ACB0IU48_TRIPR|nr:unnamed protein product [Trifolium pratense]